MILQFSWCHLLTEGHLTPYISELLYDPCTECMQFLSRPGEIQFVGTRLHETRRYPYLVCNNNYSQHNIYLISHCNLLKLSNIKKYVSLLFDNNRAFYKLLMKQNCLVLQQWINFWILGERNNQSSRSSILTYLQ